MLSKNDFGIKLTSPTEWRLKMLGLYLYTLIISHKSCNMLSILNTLTFLQVLQHFVTNTFCNVFWTRSINATKNKNKKKHKNPCRKLNWTRDLLHPKRMQYTTATPSQLRVSIVFKLFNCFDAMGRNVNKQSRICEPHIYNNFFL